MLETLFGTPKRIHHGMMCWSPTLSVADPSDTTGGSLLGPGSEGPGSSLAEPAHTVLMHIIPGYHICALWHVCDIPS